MGATRLAAAFALLFAVGAGFGRQDEAPAAPRAPLEVIYLANEGFLVRCGEDDVLVDAFLEMPYAGYAALPQDLYAKLVRAESPFDSVELALTSHVHGDHFQPGAAERFLARSEETRFATSEEVVRSLEGAEDVEAISERIEGATPEPGRVVSRSIGSIDVDFLRLRHGGKSNWEIENLGHLIELGGWRVLHLGDADMVAAEFAPYRLAGRAVDVALVPYWFFLYEPGRRILFEHVQARHWVAMHVAPAELEQALERFGKEHPEVYVPKAALDSKAFSE